MKKIVSLLLALLMVLSLCACGSKNPDTTPTNPPVTDNPGTAPEGANNATGELTTMVAGKLTIATSPDFPPFESTDDDGKVIGIEPEIMELICEKLGLELQIDTMDFDGALLAAEQGKCDAIVSGVTVTNDRKLIYDFTDSYTTIKQAIVIPEGSGITMENLGEHTIGVQRGTTGHILTEDDFGDKVQAYDTYSLVFQALNNKQVDCIVMDDAVANAYLKVNSGLSMVETTYEPEEYAFGFHKDEGNTLVEAVNKALGELIADGKVQEILDKYMSE